jgi:predicted permease
MRSEHDHPGHPRVTLLSTAFAADLLKALKRLVRAPGYACLAILALTVGIGVNAGMVALLDALLVRLPSSVADAGDLARLHFRLVDGSESITVARTTYPTVRDVASSGAYQGVAAYATAQVSIGRGADAYAGRAMLTSSAFFSVLRPAAALGRLPSAEPGAENSPDLAVVSYGFWQSYLGGRRDVIGAALPVDGRIYTITAVAAPDFHVLSTQPIDVWLPLEHAGLTGPAPSDWRNDREDIWLGVVVRRWPNRTATGADQQADAYLQNVRLALDDDEVPAGVEAQSIVPGRGAEKPTETKVALWLSGLSSVVLLIACANVSSLIMTRMLARRREYFLRIALGASAKQLRRQMFADLGAILLPGTIGAAVACYVLRNALAVLIRSDVPISREFLDARTNAFLFASSALAFVVICTVSLLQLRSVTRQQTLLSRTAETRVLSRSTRRVMLASQAGLSLILLCVAGLFAGSLARLNSLDLGIDLDRTLQVSINRSRLADTSLNIGEVLERARATLLSHPGVERVALTVGSPYKSGMGAGPWTEERGAAELWADREVAYKSFVGPGFFSAVGATSLRGRDFQETDRGGAERVAILNAPLATYLWPSETALGKCMWLDTTDYCYRIVGVLDGVWKLRVLEREQMAVYVPIAQAPGAVANTMFVRTRGDAEALVDPVRTIVQSLSPDLPAVQVLSVETLVAPEFRPWRLGATVFSAFAVIALLLTLSGVYGIVAFITSLRRREIGVRMALGARWRQVLTNVVGESLGAILAGMVVGSLAVLLVARWLIGIMFEASARDFIVLLEAGGVLLIVAAAAVAIPAIRALRIDPMTVLRAD